MDDFLPRQQGAAIDLRAHQQDALDWLALIRAEGKTLIAIECAKRLGRPVLYVAHRKNLVHQTGREFARLWIQEAQIAAALIMVPGTGRGIPRSH
jgi:superfamily II DNA or RNA helicase